MINSKFQLQRKQNQYPKLHIIHIDENLQHLCKLLDNQNNKKQEIKSQTDKIFRNSKSIINSKKQSNLIHFLMQNKTKIFASKENPVSSHVGRSFIIKQSQPIVKPLKSQKQFIQSFRTMKSYSCQQSRRQSVSLNKINTTIQEIQLGPWEE